MQDIRNAVYVRAKTLRVREDRADVFLVFDAQNEVLHELNETAGEVFRLIDGQRSVTEVIRELSQMYEAPAEEIQEDVIEVVRRFVAISIITAEPDTPPPAP